jgi:hypothetical protein
MNYNPTIEIKSFKPALTLSEETLAFTGRLYIDGKPAAHLSNRGHGDSVSYHHYKNDDGALLGVLIDNLAKAPTAKSEFFDDGLQPDLDWFLQELAGETANRQKSKRDVASKSWVRFADHKYGEDDWHVFRFKWTPENRARLEERHGPVVESRNERVAATGPLKFRQMLAKMGVELEDLAKVS